MSELYDQGSESTNDGKIRIELERLEKVVLYIALVLVVMGEAFLSLSILISANTFSGRLFLLALQTFTTAALLSIRFYGFSDDIRNRL